MTEHSELRITKSDRLEFERVENALYEGESSVEINGKMFEIVSSQLSLDGDASFVLVEI